MPMKRRTFVKNGLLFSGSLALPSMLPAQTKASGPLVVQVQGESPYEITKKAVAEIGNMDKIIARGDVVMVKPNIGWNRTVIRPPVPILKYCGR